MSTVKRPRGRVPKDIKEWLSVNDKLYKMELWKLCVCSCGRWYTNLDSLAPYHTERNLCKRCGLACDADYKEKRVK